MGEKKEKKIKVKEETQDVADVNNIKRRREIVHDGARELVERQKQFEAPDNQLFHDDEEEKTEEQRDGPKIKRKTKKIRDVKEKIGAMSWEEAEGLLGTYSHCGVRKVRECRHISLPYHQLANIPAAIKYITESQLSKFRREVRGVVLAVGPVSEVKAIRVIDDHNAFHVDVIVDQIVFRPQKDIIYEAVVTMATPTLITASLFGMISVVCPVNAKKTDAALRGIILHTGDTIMVKYTNSTVKRGICVLNGELVRLIKKAPNDDSTPQNKKMDADTHKRKNDSHSIKVKSEPLKDDEEPPKKKNKKEKKKSKKITFADSDDDAE